MAGFRVTTLTFQNCTRIINLRMPRKNLNINARHNAYFVDHIALWMPTLVPSVPIDLHKLLQDRAIAAGTLCGESCRVMIVTIHVAFVFIVRVLRAKERRTYRTCEMLDMEFLVYLND